MRKAKVDEEVAKAKRAIDSSTTNDAVDQAKDSGVTTINNIQPESIEKLKRSKRLMILLRPKERHRSRWYYYTRRKRCD